MKDRYLFKGKKIDNGEWVEGYLLKPLFGKTNIMEEPEKNGELSRIEEIDENTICQCTGLRDKNGKLIWENDIVKLPREDENFLVEWDEDTDTGRYVLNGDGAEYDFDGLWSQSVETVGNLFDDQELLEWKAF